MLVCSEVQRGQEDGLLMAFWRQWKGSRGRSLISGKNLRPWEHQCVFPGLQMGLSITSDSVAPRACPCVLCPCSRCPLCCPRLQATVLSVSQASEAPRKWIWERGMSRPGGQGAGLTDSTCGPGLYSSGQRTGAGSRGQGVTRAARSPCHHSG